MTSPAHDDATLRFYAENAVAYAAREDEAWPALDRFLDALPAGARVLELGCGDGRDAERMLDRGFDVRPTDGSPELAAIAAVRLGRAVDVLRFDALDEVAAYDAVWASACLLHVPAERLADVLARIRRALRPGGRFAASYKAGDGEGRDTLGRYYNFPTAAGLEHAYTAAGPWSALTLTQAPGGGYDGVERTWLLVDTVR